MSFPLPHFRPSGLLGRLWLALLLGAVALGAAAQPALSARAWTLLDVNSGTTLGSHRADEPLEPRRRSHGR